MLLRATSGAISLLCVGCLVPSGYPFAETSAGSGESTGAPDTGTSSASTGEHDSSGETGTPTSTGGGVCGDGVVDADEACDLGVANDEGGACLLDCTEARCGDGHVQVGVEGCDMGVDNGAGYGECDPVSCQRGAFCGDGEVQADHELCDPAAGPGDPPADVACGEDCRYAGRIVFISAGTFDGNLGSVSDADLKCQVMASAFDSENATSYRAWLSDSVSSPVTRFAHGPEFANVPYVRRDGVRVAASFDALLGAGVENPITLTETGETLTEVMVWTNTSFEGLPVSATNHCESWKQGNFTATARFGSNSPSAGEVKLWQDNRHWTTRDDALCSTQLHIYCFEQT